MILVQMDQAPYQSEPEKAAAAKPDKTAAAKLEKPAAITPMMAQFFEIKAVNPGYLLFYRMGDFYELFFEDAEIASAALNIVLTTRGKHLGVDIPMCGVPVHASQDYLRKLISFGHRVAICEQMEPPAEAKKRGAKSVVRREVIRLVTPGTLTEDDLLPAKNNNFLGALAMIAHAEDDFALAWADISTGETFVADFCGDRLADELGRLDLAELIVGETTNQFIRDNDLFAQGLVHNVTLAPEESFDSEAARKILRETFADLDPGSFTRAGRAALGALVSYVANTQKTGALALRSPKIETGDNLMQIDLATRASLEVLVTNSGATKGSLRQAIDKTITAAGSRLLARRLAAPLVSPVAINKRLDMVETFVNDTMALGTLRQALRNVPDLTRPLTRLALGRGGPRDLANVGLAIASARDVAAMLATMLADKPEMAKGLVDLMAILENAPGDIAANIGSAIVDQPPPLTKDGGFVRPGHDQQLDGQRALASKSRTIIAQLQARLADETKIKALKIKHNKVLGFFIEVPAQHGALLLKEPFAQSFIHRQSMANAMRFTTGELSTLEGQIAQAQSTALNIELEIFAALLHQVLAASDKLQQVADALAEIDLTLALATLAAENSYARPLIDNSLEFKISAGRHPVVEQTLNKLGQTFVANDCDLGGQIIARNKKTGNAVKEGGQLWLVTGPNMGGKSTFLRQNALIAILAQIGSFVPAASAHIGVLDRLFSRVGASDDIARGRSTFMVEMVETAAILNRATNRSLVILDEIGRGTATFDGLSIAWATAEALHETNACRALFATHFHEMTSLSKTLARVSNHTMKAREWRGDVVFLHEVAAGAADRSYGIQVARLAGLPEAVLERARAVLTVLESQPTGTAGIVLEDLPLFSHVPRTLAPESNPVLDMVDGLRPDELTPRQAIDFVYELKKARDASSCD
ncbi:DNA mismatch repair protein MutS [hydrothermal vent metagenome]|uniref:DNA mismatch repair protein MutS n=1 Tax=hydrothermal vent metagenome TaxID=652676 RepID=A0A3B0U9I7_9ZZZZ